MNTPAGDLPAPSPAGAGSADSATAEQGDAAGSSRFPSAGAKWRAVASAPLVALVTLIAALLVADYAGFSIRDPDGVAAGYIAMVGSAVFLLVGLDIAIRAGRRTGTRRPSREAMREVRRERWTRERGLAVGVALISFYVTYFAYRNLKAAVPLVRPGDLFDRELLDLERGFLWGTDPAALLHSVLGTGFIAHVLSALYVAFIVFLPLSLALFLVFSEKLQTSLFYATALSVNWILGAATYFMIPALGPIYADPALFADLPDSEVTYLQEILLEDRIAFLGDPANGPLQAIAAFASLHIAMSFTAALAAQLLGLDRRLRIALWTWLALTTVSTIYLGWHYVVDDIAGIAMGALALLVARVLTGFDLSAARAAQAPGKST